MSICGDVEFKIMSSDGKVQVGKISKQWSGLLREMYTDTDYFGITFPMDLDVRMKAVMLGACFLIVSTSNIVFLFRNYVTFVFPHTKYVKVKISYISLLKYFYNYYIILGCYVL